MILEDRSLATLRDVVSRLDRGFARLPALGDGEDDSRIHGVLCEVVDRMTDNYPYFHPLYAGQMLKPPHPIARLAYALAMWINPNNHALDGGRASSRMEKEAVAELAAMVGWKFFLGHLTSGGTMANLESLWIAGQIRPGKTVLASSQAHYTHSRLCGVLGIPFEAIDCDPTGRMDLHALELRLQKGDVGTVVATMGTTAVGSVDPLNEICKLRETFDFRIHCDATYGGYFLLTETLREDTRRALDAMARADSIAIDPHKHGMQPYGCGCVLFKDPSVGSFYRHDSPYTYFSSDELHLGEISLECSRPGAAAVALWATQKLFPLVRQGEFARNLERGRSAAKRLHEYLKADTRWVTAFEPELDIVVWAVHAESMSRSSELARRVFDACAERDLHLALAELPISIFSFDPSVRRDRDRVTCLRSVLMKPEHDEWMGEIVHRLNAAMEGSSSRRASSER